MIKLPVTCLCPHCGESVPITTTDAAKVLRAGRKKERPIEDYRAMGEKSAAKRWEDHIKKNKK